MLDVKISSELKEFYDRHGIPEPLRKEAEFMAQEIVIAGRRTAQETLKLGGYIYWTHQKLTHSLNNWSLEDTAEWLSKHGMRFSTKVLREFINFYLTFFNPEELGSNSIDRSLMEYYVYVNQQIESLDTLPEIKNIHTIQALFPGLEPPKDKKTARELIREAIKKGIIADILKEDPDFAREFRQQVEQWIKDQHISTGTEIEEKYFKGIRELYETMKKEKEKVEEELQKTKEELKNKTVALEMAIEERDRLEDKYREVKEELAKHTKMKGVYKQISEGFSLLEQGIELLFVLATYRGEFYDASPKLIRYYVEELDKKMKRLKVIRDCLAEMDRVITVDGGDSHDG